MMVWTYEKATVMRRTVIPNAIGVAMPRADLLAYINAIKMASVAYATEESASDEKTANAVRFGSRS